VSFSRYRDPDVDVPAQASRDARAFTATMDHADIRGLATASDLSVAGLPRSNIGDHHVDARVADSRAPLIVLAHRVTRALSVE
jgi:hypothetical protein